MISIFTGLLIALVNALAAIVIYKTAMKKGILKFSKIALTSIVIRYFITVFIVWLCLKVFSLNAFAFSLTFLLSTFFLLMFEIFYLNNRSNLLILWNRLFKKD